jgi:hypothetical protein
VITLSTLKFIAICWGCITGGCSIGIAIVGLLSANKEGEGVKYSNYTKNELIEVIKCLEHNIEALRQTIEIQYENTLKVLGEFDKLEREGVEE